ncbi:MAG: hypothetical protein ABI574_08760 [Burkholderiales bacterium]
MARDQDPKTTIDPDGLRYRSKAPGSPFTATGAFAPSTMSCFLCGKHRPRQSLKTRKLLGKAQFVCAPSCKELEATLAGNAAGTAKVVAASTTTPDTAST